MAGWKGIPRETKLKLLQFITSRPSGERAGAKRKAVAELHADAHVQFDLLEPVAAMMHSFGDVASPHPDTIALVMQHGALHGGLRARRSASRALPQCAPGRAPPCARAGTAAAPSV